MNKVCIMHGCMGLLKAHFMWALLFTSQIISNTLLQNYTELIINYQLHHMYHMQSEKNSDQNSTRTITHVHC